MSLGLIGGILSSLAGPLGKVAERYFDNKDDQQAFQNAVELEILKNQKEFTDISANIVLAEAKSEHWLTATWRPAMMYMFMFVIAIHIVIIPYFIIPVLWMIGYPIPVFPELPEHVWTLITIGLGGYVGGRSGEKMIKEWKK